VLLYDDIETAMSAHWLLLLTAVRLDKGEVWWEELSKLDGYEQITELRKQNLDIPDDFETWVIFFRALLWLISSSERG
jgi:hypothetical protein